MHFRLCAAAYARSCGVRAISPVALSTISHSTPEGWQPARRARSTEAWAWGKAQLTTLDVVFNPYCGRAHAEWVNRLKGRPDSVRTSQIIERNACNPSCTLLLVQPPTARPTTVCLNACLLSQSAKPHPNVPHLCPPLRTSPWCGVPSICPDLLLNLTSVCPACAFCCTPQCVSWRLSPPRAPSQNASSHS